jgi:hypothetical protein
MTARPVSADLFTPIAGPAVDVLIGIDLLASRSLWPVGAERWAEVVARVKAFENAYGMRARACGWSDLSLYGVHRHAPYANLAAMGAAFVVARSGHRVAAVTAGDMLLISPTGAMLRIFRGEPDPSAALAWTLRRPD